MPTLIINDDVKLEIDETRWRLYRDYAKLSTVNTLLEFLRGSSVITYNPDYGAHVGLPGNMVSVNYVRAVLVGYQDSSKRWVLGLHLAQNTEDAPVFRPILRWAEGDSNDHIHEVRQAAQGLAVLLVAPLKIFGEKKLPAQNFDPNRTGITGPLAPHIRNRVEAEAVKRKARDYELPINGDNFSLAKKGDTLILKLGKSPAAQHKIEAPVFNLCEINTQNKKIKLVPPTGLLGSFIGTRGKEVHFDSIFNVEYRYIKARMSKTVPSKDGRFSEEQITFVHSWGVYLTLKDESMLILMTGFAQSPELMQKRVTMTAGAKLETSSIEGLNYFRQHLEEQEKIEGSQAAVEAAAYRIAAAVGTALVKTDVEG